MNATVKTNTGSFFSRATNSQYMDWLTEYDTTSQPRGTNQVIGRGSLVGTHTITPQNTKTNLLDAEIQKELATQIGLGTARGGLPKTKPGLRSGMRAFAPGNVDERTLPSGDLVQGEW